MRYAWSIVSGAAASAKEYASTSESHKQGINGVRNICMVPIALRCSLHARRPGGRMLAWLLTA